LQTALGELLRGREMERKKGNGGEKKGKEMKGKQRMRKESGSEAGKERMERERY